MGLGLFARLLLGTLLGFALIEILTFNDPRGYPQKETVLEDAWQHVAGEVIELFPEANTEFGSQVSDYVVSKVRSSVTGDDVVKFAVLLFVLSIFSMYSALRYAAWRQLARRRRKRIRLLEKQVTLMGGTPAKSPSLVRQLFKPAQRNTARDAT